MISHDFLEARRVILAMLKLSPTLPNCTFCYILVKLGQIMNRYDFLVCYSGEF